MNLQNVKKHYEPLETTEVCSGLVSRICAQSVVSTPGFNSTKILPQESGGEVDMQQEGYNHNWDDGDVTK